MSMASNDQRQKVWVFHGEGARFASGVFSSKELASAWIARHGLSGLLTVYPLDEGAYQWAVNSGNFVPKTPDQRTAEFPSADCLVPGFPY